MNSVADQLRSFCYTNDIEGVRRLLKDGAPHDPDVYGRTPLFYAMNRGSGELVQLLLDHGADPQLASENGTTPLSYGARSGNYNAVRLLLEHGVEQTPGKHGFTPLIEATRGRNGEVVKLLLEYGADHRGDENGSSPLNWAYFRGFVKISAYLLEGGATHEPENSWSYTPLQLALEGNKIECVKLLLEHGADPTLIAIVTLSVYAQLKLTRNFK